MSDNGDAIIVDGDEGILHLRPQLDRRGRLCREGALPRPRQLLFRELRDKPNQTKDGVAVDLLMNAGLLVDLPQLAESGAGGIGLFRTELQFMVASTFPRAEAQESFYRSVLDAARRQAGHLPHDRHRRRQGSALFQGRQGRRESGARLARDPVDAGPPGRS
jgi:phosphotransferase system enzyme I (PtsP)